MYLREVGPLNLDDSVSCTMPYWVLCWNYRLVPLFDRLFHFQSFTLQVTLRQVYNDSRLAYQPSIGAQEYFKLTSAEEINKIWQPDTFVRNERKIHFHETLQCIADFCHLIALILFCKI